MSIKSVRMRWRDALAADVLAAQPPPIVSTYWIASRLLLLVIAGRYDGKELQLPKVATVSEMLSDARDALLKRGILQRDRSLPNYLFRTVHAADADAAQLMCVIDPFGYIAYLSAMAHYGLTNRLPKILYFVTPDSTLWREMANEKMATDLGEWASRYRLEQLPELKHSKIEKISGVLLQTIRTKQLGGWRYGKNQTIRVTGLGRTFLDMLRRPDLCGGVRHVIEVYEEHASTHLGAIIAEFNSHGAVIDRMRAGYVLEEYCDISDPRIEEWAEQASRGGSRKLDPQAGYSSNFSEKWALSINV